MKDSNRLALLIILIGGLCFLCGLLIGKNQHNMNHAKKTIRVNNSVFRDEIVPLCYMRAYNRMTQRENSPHGHFSRAYYRKTVGMTREL